MNFKDRTMLLTSVLVGSMIVLICKKCHVSDFYVINLGILAGITIGIIFALFVDDD